MTARRVWGNSVVSHLSWRQAGWLHYHQAAGGLCWMKPLWSLLHKRSACFIDQWGSCIHWKYFRRWKFRRRLLGLKLLSYQIGACLQRGSPLLLCQGLLNDRELLSGNCGQEWAQCLWRRPETSQQSRRKCSISRWGSRFWWLHS